MENHVTVMTTNQVFKVQHYPLDMNVHIPFHAMHHTHGTPDVYQMCSFQMCYIKLQQDYRLIYLVASSTKSETVFTSTQEHPGQSSQKALKACGTPCAIMQSSL